MESAYGNVYVLCDKSMAEVFDDGKILFYPNFKIWKKPKNRTKRNPCPPSEYVWNMKTKEGAIGLLTELDRQLKGDIKNKTIKV